MTSGKTTDGTNGARRPLEGLKLLDLTWFGAGPIGTRAMANLGTDVVRIETEKRVDGLRIAQPRPPGATSYNQSGYFNNFNADKRSVTIDLTTERGHELGIGLVQWADVMMTNMTNRAIRQIGMTWERVSAANPRIIAMYQPMQGMTGPHSEFQGFGAVLCTICGANYLAGSEGNVPVGVGTNYPDYVVNPIHAAVALLAAVRHQRRTGEGQLIDASQLESSVAAMSGALFAHDNPAEGESPPPYHRIANRVPFAAPHGAYRAAGDDDWVAIACLDGEQWRALAAACGQPQWADDTRFATLEARKRHEDELDSLIGGWTAGRPAVKVMETLQAAGVPAGVVQDARQVLDDPHMAERGYFVRLDHPELGEQAYDGSGFSLSRTPAEPRRHAPLLGEHTYEVATEILGLSDDEIAALVEERVLF